jgi:hypothetical protein
MHEAGNPLANSPDEPSYTRECRVAVFAYLASAPGVDTPSDIGWQLVNLNWLGVGCFGVPSADQIHATRVGMEELAYLEARGEASERFEEVTGVYCRRSYQRRGGASS